MLVERQNTQILVLTEPCGPKISPQIVKDVTTSVSLFLTLNEIFGIATGNDVDFIYLSTPYQLRIPLILGLGKTRMDRICPEISLDTDSNAWPLTNEAVELEKKQVDV